MDSLISGVLPYLEDPKNWMSISLQPDIIVMGFKPGGRGTRISRQTGMCHSNGSLFYKKFLDIGPVFSKKSLNMDPIYDWAQTSRFSHGENPENHRIC